MKRQDRDGRELPTLLVPSESRGVTDPVLEWMIEQGMPLTLDVWLELNYPDGVEYPLDAEIVAGIPEELRDQLEE